MSTAAVADPEYMDEAQWKRENTKRASVSVSSMIPKMKRFVLEIAASEDDRVPPAVVVANGDYSKAIQVGRRVIVPEAIVTALRDARGYVPRLDGEGKVLGWKMVQSFPYTATAYDGKLPIGTEVDHDDNPIAAPGQSPRETNMTGGEE